MFRGMDGQTGRLGSRSMKPPGGESSDQFRSLEERIPSACKPNRMASNIFGPPEEPKNIPKRINPQGGKGSGIFDESTPVKTRQCLNPLGGKASDIFGSPVTATAPLAHPNKPKDHVLLREGEDSKSDPSTTTNTTPRGERAKKPESTSTVDNHEPRMGPRPRSHNKVLNPPGGKSSISFY